jgi:DNA replication protein DnaC
MSRLKELCKELRVGNLQDLTGEVEFNDPDQYLTDLLELVLKQRRARKANKLIKQAGFPVAKTLDDYDFSPVAFPESIDKEGLTSLEFVDRKENVLMIGSVGTGKTHLATALGIKACMQGKRVAFYRAVELTNELLEKHEDGEEKKLMKKIEKADLFILDELGYIPFTKKRSQLLFSVISRSYEHQSIIVTSNLEFGRWNEVFGDEHLTAALLDRVVHHANILTFSGESFRFKKAIANQNKSGEGRYELSKGPLS